MLGVKDVERPIADDYVCVPLGNLLADPCAEHHRAGLDEVTCDQVGERGGFLGDWRGETRPRLSEMVRMIRYLPVLVNDLDIVKADGAVLPFFEEVHLFL